MNEALKSEDEAVRFLSMSAQPQAVNVAALREHLAFLKEAGFDPGRVYRRVVEERPSWFRPLPPLDEVRPKAS
jgi:hypothetical protein